MDARAQGSKEVSKHASKQVCRNRLGRDTLLTYVRTYLSNGLRERLELLGSAALPTLAPRRPPRAVGRAAPREHEHGVLRASHPAREARVLPVLVRVRVIVRVRVRVRVITLAVTLTLTLAPTLTLALALALGCGVS